MVEELNRMTRNTRVYPDSRALASSAAEEFFSRALDAFASRRTFSCALSGGSTPLQLFAQMSDQCRLASLPAGFWDSVHFFWGDERDVPPDHPDSNYGQAREALLCKIDIPQENIHPIRPVSGSPSLTAVSYENELNQFFASRPGDTPRFDLIFLGMGADGHVASLFPHSEALNETTRMVAAPWVAKFNSYRITLTLPVINNAACIIFLIQGGRKAEMLARVLTEIPQSDQLPAQAIRPGNGELLWLLDQAAAGRLQQQISGTGRATDGA